MCRWVKVSQGHNSQSQCMGKMAFGKFTDHVCILVVPGSSGRSWVGLWGGWSRTCCVCRRRTDADCAGLRLREWLVYIQTWSRRHRGLVLPTVRYDIHYSRHVCYTHKTRNMCNRIYIRTRTSGSNSLVRQTIAIADSRSAAVYFNFLAKLYVMKTAFRIRTYIMSLVFIRVRYLQMTNTVTSL